MKLVSVYNRDMAKIELQLPTIQNWSCHSCGGCCKQHLISITTEERDRIVKQNWTAADGVPADQPVVEKNRGSKTRPFRLAHQPDGACVFLQEDGLCRIHAKFGEAAKPLACRIYPYAFHPKGNQIAIGLRYSCPSVVANKGAAVLEQRGELKRLAEQVVPDEYRKSSPPRLTPSEQLEWNDTLKVIDALDDSFADEQTPFLLSLLRTISWVDLLSQATFGKLSGARVTELISILRESAQVEWEELPTAEAVKQPSGLARVLFRLLISVYGRKETLQELDSPFRSRLLSLTSTMGFAWGGGRTPRLHDDLPKVSFKDVEALAGPLPAGADELFRRYFRMKIQGMHFCGAAYYDYPVTTGFFSLTLMYPVILWIARWIAVGKGESAISQGSLELAMTIADHHQGYSPVLGLGPFRKRVEHLHKLGQLPPLMLRYALSREETA